MYGFCWLLRLYLLEIKGARVQEGAASQKSKTQPSVKRTPTLRSKLVKSAGKASTVQRRALQGPPASPQLSASGSSTPHHSGDPQGRRCFSAVPSGTGDSSHAVHRDLPDGKGRAARTDGERLSDAPPAARRWFPWRGEMQRGRLFSGSGTPCRRPAGLIRPRSDDAGRSRSLPSAIHSARWACGYPGGETPKRRF